MRSHLQSTIQQIDFSMSSEFNRNGQRYLLFVHVRVLSSMTKGSPAPLMKTVHIS